MRTEVPQQAWTPRPRRDIHLKVTVWPCVECGGKHAPWWGKSTPPPSHASA